jgi:transposase
MISRELKLKPTKKQKQTLLSWFPILTGIYNWGIREIELNANNKIYFSKFDLKNMLSGHNKRLNIPSHTIQETITQAHISWDRCFKKIAKKPKLKSVHNKLRSIPFPDLIPSNRIKENKIRVPIIGWIRYYKQKLPDGKIKCARIIKRASGWYLILTIDAVHKFKVKKNKKKVGIDTGLKTLATLSDGTKFDNKKNFVKSQRRLAQAQRGRDWKLVGRLNERIKNRRKDWNHKVSRKIVEDYSEIYITKDNLRNQAKIFGKSVNDAGIAQLRNFIICKGELHNRKVKLVDSKYTTMICSNCGAKDGPKGLDGLAVRDWECSSCGEQHDRDINAAKVILNLGLGWSLDNVGTHAEKPETSKLELFNNKHQKETV